MAATMVPLERERVREVCRQHAALMRERQAKGAALQRAWEELGQLRAVEGDATAGEQHGRVAALQASIEEYEALLTTELEARPTLYYMGDRAEARLHAVAPHTNLTRPPLPPPSRPSGAAARGTRRDPAA